MKTIEDLIKWFENACKPLMRYLCENHNPHTKVIIDGNSSQIFEGI